MAFLLAAGLLIGFAGAFGAALEPAPVASPFELPVPEVGAELAERPLGIGGRLPDALRLVPGFGTGVAVLSNEDAVWNPGGAIACRELSAAAVEEGGSMVIEPMRDSACLSTLG
jgi:hypothetical protein